MIPTTSQLHVAGSAAPEEQPRTPRDIPHRGGAANPSAEALRARFPDSVIRVEVVWGETTVHVDGARVLDLVRWLHEDAEQRYDFLVDVTAVEYRDRGRPLEVVWHLRSLPFRRFLRLKAALPQAGPLEVSSVWPVFRSADWLERECYDMFGVRFVGHPDLRRILMWEYYKEGHPLRKDFPLRGRFSRSEQLRQVLSANREARYSMEELSIAEAVGELPEDMRRRLGGGAPTGE